MPERSRWANDTNVIHLIGRVLFAEISIFGPQWAR